MPVKRRDVRLSLQRLVTVPDTRLKFGTRRDTRFSSLGPRSLSIDPRF